MLRAAACDATKLATRGRGRRDRRKGSTPLQQHHHHPLRLRAAACEALKRMVLGSACARAGLVAHSDGGARDRAVETDSGTGTGAATCDCIETCTTAPCDCIETPETERLLGLAVKATLAQLGDCDRARDREKDEKKRAPANANAAGDCDQLALAHRRTGCDDDEEDCDCDGDAPAVTPVETTGAAVVALAPLARKAAADLLQACAVAIARGCEGGGGKIGGAVLFSAPQQLAAACARGCGDAALVARAAAGHAAHASCEPFWRAVKERGAGSRTSRVFFISSSSQRKGWLSLSLSLSLSSQETRLSKASM